MFAHPEPGFARYRGCYRVKCRNHPIPRFRCSVCQRGFSRQTFRADYRDHKPELNGPLLGHLSSGSGLRQTARVLGLTRRCTTNKAHKLARNCWLLHENLQQPFVTNCSLQLDELVTFEGCRRTRPVTAPILIEAESMLVLAVEAEPIRPSGKRTRRRERQMARDEQRFGRRVDGTRAGIEKVFAVGAKLCARLPQVRLRTDQKPCYEPLARSVFGALPLVHERIPGALPKSTKNPLFRINLTLAKSRDQCGRLRRRSWLASKDRKYLRLHLGVFVAYTNYVRRRFNGDERTPAMVVNWLEERLDLEDLAGWSQRFGDRSLHPLGCGSRTICGLREERRIGA